jgi:hypothetical protein
LEGDLGSECFDESLKMGNATIASLEHVDGIADHCSVDFAIEQFCQ